MTKHLHVLTAVAAAVLAAGCSLAPKYERPAAPVASTYPTAATQGTTAANDIAWQDFFADPVMRRLIAAALQNNRDLRVAVLNIEQARAQYQIRRADEFPTVNGQFSATRAPSTVTGNVGNTFSVGLGISAWEIDFFGRVANLKDQALAQYLASEEGRKAAQISLVSAVANAWLAVLADEELLEITRQTLATREESLRLTKLRFDNGASSELDFRQAETLAQAARVTLAQQRRQRLLDENALVLLLGQPLPVESPSAAAGSTLAAVQAFPSLPAGLPSDLLVRRPDVRQAEQTLIGANANIGAARAAFFPRISLTASVGSVSNELSGLFKSGSGAFSIAPSVLLPIFDAGRNQANLEVSQASRDIAVAQYEKSIQTAFREVADALAGNATLSDQLQAQQAQADSESARLRLSDLRYRNGIASYLDLLDAQRSLFTTRQAVVQTRLAQLQNQVTLYKTLGGGWTETAR